ncbi:MAG TPA: hypothetical protein VG798_03655 [Rhizomicrobium sp.]|nr:hypothetical protein [Rhizomicrobium sp.]
MFGLGWAELSLPRQPQYQEQAGKTKSPEKSDHVTPSQSGEEALATYTLWLVIFTGILAASTIGLWLVTEKTLRHAKGEADRQSRDMRDSIAAAEAANEIARTSFIESRRAWLDITETQLTAPTALTDDRLLIGMNIKVKNLGSTPALNAAVGMDISFGGVSFKEVGDRLRERIRRRSTELPLGHNVFPGETMEYGERTGFGPEAFASSIYKLPTGTRQTMLTLMVMVAYKIVGDNLVRHTYRTYAFNLEVGIEMKEGMFWTLETMPFMAGDIS